MKKPSFFLSFMAALAVVGGGPTSWAQTNTQTIILTPGRNAIFLEVMPTNPAMGAVFSNSAITSVWTPLTRPSTVAFVQNPNQAPFNTAGWLVYIPTNQPQSVNNNLYAVAVNTPYVVYVGGSANVTFTITGRPSLLASPFLPQAYTLRGFPIDPANLTTFQNFFQWSAGHYNNGAGPLTSIYRLGPTGQWVQANNADFMQRDVPYWVYTPGASSYVAPLSATLAVGDGMDFGTATSEIDLALTNNTANGTMVTISNLATSPSLLVYMAGTPPGPVGWTPMPQYWVTNVSAKSNLTLRFSIQRSQIDPVTGYYGSVLQLTDGNGTLLRVPASAQSQTYTQAGLWIGDISVNAVAETYNNITNTTPVAQPFVMRAILHVTPGGQIRFVRDVIEMATAAQYTTNSAGYKVQSQAPQTVLLTEPSLVSQFQGVATRDGVPVGRRFSTAGFDFDQPANGLTFLTMTGVFGIGNTAAVTVNLSASNATNPFLHRYNPDHDNLDANYKPLASNVPQEVYAISRQIQFTFTPTDPSGQTATDYGATEIGGTYQETITGLHQNPLASSGTFHLVRADPAPYLNVNQ